MQFLWYNGDNLHDQEGFPLLPRFLSRRSPLPLLALFLLPSLASGPASAQTNTPGAPPAAASLPDLMPLKKALAPLAGSGLLETQSSLKMTGSRGGATFTFRQNAHILARAPGRFRAELSPVGTDGTPRPKLVVVSDGLRVWTYRPGQRAYSVVTRQAFEAASDDVTALGLAVGGFFVGDGRELATAFRDITKDNSAAVLAALADTGVTLTSKAQSVGGVDYYVYHMNLSRQGLAYLFYVDSQTSALKRIDLTGKTDGMQIAFEETLTSLRVPASLPASTFTWSPPPGAKKSAAVTVDPF